MAVPTTPLAKYVMELVVGAVLMMKLPSALLNPVMALFRLITFTT